MGVGWGVGGSSEGASNNGTRWESSGGWRVRGGDPGGCRSCVFRRTALRAAINQREREESWTRGRKPESWACSGLGFGVSTPVRWLPGGEMESDSALS